MAAKFLELTFTDSVRKAQEHYYGKSRRTESAPEHDELTDDEARFIQSRDSFYMATINESGWLTSSIAAADPGFSTWSTRPRSHSRITRATGN
jgi:hypothetical protein